MQQVYSYSTIQYNNKHTYQLQDWLSGKSLYSNYKLIAVTEELAEGIDI